MILEANLEAFNCIFEIVISRIKLDLVSKNSHEITDNKIKVKAKKKE
jgi:hypothetical protein